MPQNPAAATIARTPGGSQSAASLDAGNNLMTNSGGLLSALGITAAKVLKATPGRINKVMIQLGTTAPTAGYLTINDCATTGTASAANEIVSIPFGSITAGAILTLDFPCQVGITISALPTGGTSLQLAVSYS